MNSSVFWCIDINLWWCWIWCSIINSNTYKFWNWFVRSSIPQILTINNSLVVSRSNPVFIIKWCLSDKKMTNSSSSYYEDDKLTFSSRIRRTLRLRHKKTTTSSSFSRCTLEGVDRLFSTPFFTLSWDNVDDEIYFDSTICINISTRELDSNFRSKVLIFFLLVGSLDV